MPLRPFGQLTALTLTLAPLPLAAFGDMVAPLLQYASLGLWQIIRIFTGFYNIPVIAIVLVGLFTQRVPALAAKIVIVFHLVAYALCQFVFRDLIDLHFLHLYAVLFLVEVAIMLIVGARRPRAAVAAPAPDAKVDLAPWHYAVPCAVTLLSCVVGLYLLFSVLGVVGGFVPGFYAAVSALLGVNLGIWIIYWRRAWRRGDFAA